MEIRNCTPHVLNIIKQDGEVLDIFEVHSNGRAKGNEMESI